MSLINRCLLEITLQGNRYKFLCFQAVICLSDCLKPQRLLIPPLPSSPPTSIPLRVAVIFSYPSSRRKAWSGQELLQPKGSRRSSALLHTMSLGLQITKRDARMSNASPLRSLMPILSDKHNLAVRKLSSLRASRCIRRVSVQLKLNWWTHHHSKTFP